MKKTHEEINEKIKRKKAVVVTAEEILSWVDEKGYSQTAREVDVVTTGTFGAMCSSGAFINFGHAKPRIRAERVWLNNVEAYAGIAAVDCYIGATQPRINEKGGEPDRDFTYGGGHVIQDLASKKPVHVKAVSHGTDCYPNTQLQKEITIDQIPDAHLYCPRNAYQNYNCAVNRSNQTLHTYMGILKPDFRNANYSGAGQLSPLMNDPRFKTIGIGTRIFLGGGIGYVVGPGTQHNPNPPRTDGGVPKIPSGTLAVTGDLKQMSGDWLQGIHFKGYGTTLRVGLGVPIPILDEEILRYASIRDEEIIVPIVDYSYDYPESTGKSLGEVRFSDIRNGRIEFEGRTIPVYNLSDIKAARRVADYLKTWIQDGQFLLGKPVELIPSL